MNGSGAEIEGNMARDGAGGGSIVYMENQSVTLKTLARAAEIFGIRLQIDLVDACPTRLVAPLSLIRFEPRRAHPLGAEPRVDAAATREARNLRTILHARV